MELSLNEIIRAVPEGSMHDICESPDVIKLREESEAGYIILRRVDASALPITP